MSSAAAQAYARVASTSASPREIEAQALLMHGTHTAGTAVRGVQPEQELRAVGLAERIEGGRIGDAMADLDPRLHVGRTVLQLLVRRQRSAEGVPVEHPLHGDLKGLFHRADHLVQLHQIGQL